MPEEDVDKATMRRTEPNTQHLYMLKELKQNCTKYR
jgi:hypothetical protein